MTFVSSIALPSAIHGPAPRLDTIDRVEMVLRKAHLDDEGPLSFAEIKRRMGVKSIRHSTIRTSVEHLARFGLVTLSPSKGVMWTLQEKPSAWSRKGFRKMA